MLGLENLAPASAIATVDNLLRNPAAQLEVPAAVLLAPLDRRQATEVINRTIGEPPRRITHLLPAIAGLLTGGPAGAVVTGSISYNAEVIRHNSRIKAISSILQEIVIVRPMVGLTDPEKALLPAVACAYAAGSLSHQTWEQFLARLAWNEGNCLLAKPPHLAAHKHVPLAEDSLRALFKATQPPHATMLEEAAKLVATQAPPAVSTKLNPGARWMSAEDRAASRVYTNNPRANGLLIGMAEDGRPMMFAGNESLITIGGPGTGKTQAQVIPNLLNYPGSAFVLDVKDELWNLTAGRRSNFGPVYRFAPTDPTGSTHAYNPFDLISRDPDQAALDCQSLAHQLILERPDLKDPYWEDRGRDFLWTFALAIALTAGPTERTLERLAAYLSMPLAFDDLSGPAYRHSETARAIALLRSLAAKTGIADIANNATAMETALTTESNRMESVFDTARRHVAVFSRAAHVRRALSRSDWHPLDLRKRPGTTVYFCLKPGELRAFAPLVRIVFQQHAAALTKDFAAKPGALPVTFFLDEMPQLGNLAAINDILDVGRGAGLRLWLFAQYLGQIRDIYGARANGLINACQIRSFLQPDHDAAEFIAPALGKTRSLFKGEDRPLAEPYDLMGRAYADKIIALARGERPVLLDKLVAHRHYGHWMRLKPPAVRKLAHVP
ncbi:MAG: type IV secretory system conjugative DNA transfer family protein [Hyphomicrobiaceae bacterium]|nr:type IV secretory system conjugative DNA transfer family protein [Hyphomicrobiaceae bacterium]